MSAWIDAKQHKPEAGDVLVFGPKGIAVAYYHESMRAWMNARGGTISVTHWMPLPAAPVVPRDDDARAEDGNEATEGVSHEWALRMWQERFGQPDAASPEGESSNEVDRLQRRLEQVRTAPSTEPAGRALREQFTLEDRVARLERNIDQLLARITMLEAGIAPYQPTQKPWPEWPNPVITCGGGR